jgi:hypothetical protein
MVAKTFRVYVAANQFWFVWINMEKKKSDMWNVAEDQFVVEDCAHTSVIFVKNIPRLVPGGRQVCLVYSQVLLFSD